MVVVDASAVVDFLLGAGSEASVLDRMLAAWEPLSGPLLAATLLSAEASL